MIKHNLKRQSIYQISILIIFLDQITKHIARKLLTENLPQVFIPYIFNVRLVKNTGAAFSILTNATPFLSFISLLVALSLIIWIWFNSPTNLWKGFAIAFLLGGTMGNGLDRWFLGHVTDFIEIIPINFPIFNIADISINIAVGCFFIDILKERDRNKQQ